MQRDYYEDADYKSSPGKSSSIQFYSTIITELNTSVKAMLEK
jgi:hypothetical protein